MNPLRPARAGARAGAHPGNTGSSSDPTRCSERRLLVLLRCEHADSWPVAELHAGAHCSSTAYTPASQRRAPPAASARYGEPGRMSLRAERGACHVRLAIGLWVL
jgi:hypothetical protein